MVSLSPWASPKLQNVVPVIVEKPPLAFREGSYRDPLIDKDAHPVKGCSISYRRKDELAVTLERDEAFVEEMVATLECEVLDRNHFQTRAQARRAIFAWIEGWYNRHRRRSEEHTSELQSQSNLVCRLLLEKIT